MFTFPLNWHIGFNLNCTSRFYFKSAVARHWLIDWFVCRFLNSCSFTGRLICIRIVCWRSLNWIAAWSRLFVGAPPIGGHQVSACPSPGKRGWNKTTIEKWIFFGAKFSCVNIFEKSLPHVFREQDAPSLQDSDGTLKNNRGDFDNDFYIWWLKREIITWRDEKRKRVIKRGNLARQPGPSQWSTPCSTWR